MPTYQYACTDSECGNRFELVQSFTDAAASECPVCGSPVRKVFSAVGVVFKGSGFYRTDSRAGNKTASKSSSTSEKSADSSGTKEPAAASTSSSGSDTSATSSTTSDKAAASA